MTKHEELYTALWGWLKAAGAWPTYYSPVWLTGLDLERGRFVVDAERSDGQPEIRLPRTPVPDPPDEPNLGGLSAGELLEELMTLAHEAGHFESHKNRLAPEGLDALLAAIKEARHQPTAAEAQGIYEEEARAWDFGRALLQRHGFEDWPAFDKQRAAALKSYERLLIPAG